MIEVIAVCGAAALGWYARGRFGSLPMVWAAVKGLFSRGE